jgi:hypothetical protein
MENEDWEAFYLSAVAFIDEVRAAAGAVGGVAVEWFSKGGDPETVSYYRVDPERKAVAFSRDIVEQWFVDCPPRQAADRFEGLVLRAAAALLAGPSAWEYGKAVELHVRSAQEEGLGDDYVAAFDTASAILESHRLDERVLDLIPDAEDRLSELVLFDLEAHPTFDVYPRAAIVMGRLNVPRDIAQPASDEFIARFGIEEADELVSLLNAYSDLASDALDEMVELTSELVFLAFPEAVGLAWFDDGEGPAADDLWDFKGSFPADDRIGWDELELLLAQALALFTGHAGLDFGDALLVGLEDNALDGPQIAAWAAGSDIRLELGDLPIPPLCYPALTANGWVPFENAPSSLHRQVAVGEVRGIAHELMWILRDLVVIPAPAGLTIWARGPAAEVARDLERSLDDTEPGAVGTRTANHEAPSDQERPVGMSEALANAGLLLPPLGPFGVADIRTFGNWSWGTRHLPELAMYMFEVGQVIETLGEGPLFSMNHAGHGLNSYGLTLVTTGGPFAVFSQHGFGGVYMDPLSTRLRINAAYTHLHVLLKAQVLNDAINPRWLLLYSQFRDYCGIVDLDQVRGGAPWEQAIVAFPDFESLIRGAVALVPDEEFIASGGPINWGNDEPAGSIDA